MNPRFYEIRARLKANPELRICHVIDRHYLIAQETMEGFGDRYFAAIPGEVVGSKRFDEAGAQ